MLNSKKLFWGINMDTKDVLKTGTTTVGIKCRDAIILAADKRATVGNFIADKQTKKKSIYNK